MRFVNRLISMIIEHVDKISKKKKKEQKYPLTVILITISAENITMNAMFTPSIVLSRSF